MKYGNLMEIEIWLYSKIYTPQQIYEDIWTTKDITNQPQQSNHHRPTARNCQQRRLLKINQPSSSSQSHYVLLPFLILFIFYFGAHDWSQMSTNACIYSNDLWLNLRKRDCTPSAGLAASCIKNKIHLFSSYASLYHLFLSFLFPL